MVRVKKKQPIILIDTSDATFDKICMDIMGPLSMSISGYAYILTIQDLLSKYLIAIPLKNTRAIDVADGFVKEFI